MRRRTAMAGAWLLLALAPARSVFGQSSLCDQQRAHQAEVRIDEIKSWPDLRGWFAAYAGCDDGGIADGLDDFVTTLLATRWDEAPELERLLRDDPVFTRFVLDHIGGSANDLDSRTVVSNAMTRCTPGMQDLCADLVSLDRYRAKEDPEARRTGPPPTDGRKENPKAARPKTHGRGQATFPGATSSRAPRSGLTLAYSDRSSGASGAEGSLHQLTLRNRVGRQIWTYQFSGRVTVAWAPEGRSFAVTESGNDIAATLVVALHQDDSVDVYDLFVEVMAEVRQHRFLDNAHLYVEALRWQSPAALGFQVRGYGTHDPKGFKHTYTYRLGRGVSP
jgi:hypothetical protein